MVRDGRGLSRCARGRFRSGSVLLVRWYATNESETDPLRDRKLAVGESARPGDQITGSAITGSFGLEEPEYMLCAVRRPRRDDPPIGFAECLRGTHPGILAAPSARVPRADPTAAISR